MGISDQITINYDRRFGVEIELNSFDGRDFKIHPLRSKEKPRGIDYIACLVSEVVGHSAKVTRWHHTHNNFLDWIIKPDSSCGIEICSPASSGREHLDQIELVVDTLAADDRVKLDDRCSLHLHVNITDCIYEEKRFFNNEWGFFPELSNDLAAIIAYWIKCEAVFFDSVPKSRKRNPYCQCIGLSDLFTHDGPLNAMDLISNLGDHKYLSLNTYHLMGDAHGRPCRPTIEFRIIEKEGCLNKKLVRNWTRLILHFIEMAKDRGIPKKYKKNDPWSSLLWLDPKDVFTLLRFYDESLDEDLQETRNWFLARLLKNIDTDLEGIWSKDIRKIAKKEIEEIFQESGLTEDQIFSCL
jgi:hypothetical protein